MASKKNMSSANQGPRLRPAKTKGKVSGNRMGKPALAANLKNSQGTGGGLKQGFQPGKRVTTNPRGSKRGLNQGESIASASNRKVGPKAKTNLSPMKAQPKYPKNNRPQPKNNLTGHNSVGPSDVNRIRQASKFPPVSTGGSSFGGFIGAK